MRGFLLSTAPSPMISFHVWIGISSGFPFSSLSPFSSSLLSSFPLTSSVSSYLSLNKTITTHIHTQTFFYCIHMHDKISSSLSHFQSNFCPYYFLNQVLPWVITIEHHLLSLSNFCFCSIIIEVFLKCDPEALWISFFRRVLLRGILILSYLNFPYSRTPSEEPLWGNI